MSFLPTEQSGSRRPTQLYCTWLFSFKVHTLTHWTNVLSDNTGQKTQKCFHLLQNVTESTYALPSGIIQDRQILFGTTHNRKYFYLGQDKKCFYLGQYRTEKSIWGNAIQKNTSIWDNTETTLFGTEKYFYLRQ